MKKIKLKYRAEELPMVGERINRLVDKFGVSQEVAIQAVTTVDGVKFKVAVREINAIIKHVKGYRVPR